jgi:L-iditol 2-dehydrogenase
MRGDNVLVAGQGPIGLMFTRLLQLQGVNVLATDLLPARLRLARQFGAQWTFNPRRIRNLVAATFRLRLPKRTTPSERDLKVAATTHGFDAAVVAVPSDAVVREALALVRPGGQVLLFAHTKRRKAESQNAESEIQKPEVGAPPFPPSAFPPSAFPLDFSAICLDEKDLIGSYSSDFTLQREVARLVFSRQLDVRRLITHYFPLGETAKAIALAASPTPASLKILVRVAR